MPPLGRPPSQPRGEGTGAGNGWRRETPLQRLSSRADELLDRSVRLLERANDVAGRLANVADRIDPGRVDAAFRKVDDLLATLSATGRDLHRLVSESRVQLRQVLRQAGVTLADIDRFATLAGDAAQTLDRVSLQAREALRTSSGTLSATLYDLREASQSFKELGRKLSAQPSELLFSKQPRARELP